MWGTWRWRWRFSFHSWLSTTYSSWSPISQLLNDLPAFGYRCYFSNFHNLTICQSHSPGRSTIDVFSFSIACIWLSCRLSATGCEVAIRIGNMLVHACDIICCGSGNCPHDWVLGCNFRFLSLPLPVIRYVEVKGIIPREYFGSCSTSTVSYSADNDLQFPKLVFFQTFRVFPVSNLLR